MAKDGTNRGGARIGAGAKKKPLADRIAEGNPGKRELTVIDFTDSTVDLEGQPMPKPSKMLSAKQKNGKKLVAAEVYKKTWNWLHERGCAALVSPELLERYAMSVARWIQCEEAITEFGFLAKHPTTGNAIQSPYVAMSQNFMSQTNGYCLKGTDFHPAQEPEAEATSTEETGLTITIPLENVNVRNLTNLLDAKGFLIKHALHIDDLRFELSEDNISFPWFSELPAPDEIYAYSTLIAALCKMSKEQKRISATEKPVDNERYAFRCFLLRLGFIGDEYKTDRKILMRYLPGNSAFKGGEGHAISK